MHWSYTDCVHWFFSWYLICHSNIYQSAYWIKSTFWYKFREMIFCQSIIWTSIHFPLYFIKKNRVTLRNLSIKEAIVFQCIKMIFVHYFCSFSIYGGRGHQVKFNNIKNNNSKNRNLMFFASNCFHLCINVSPIHSLWHEIT